MPQLSEGRSLKGTLSNPCDTTQQTLALTNLWQEGIRLALEAVDDVLGAAHRVAFVNYGGLGEGKD